jgi:hypothetical protein
MSIISAMIASPGRVAPGSCQATRVSWVMETPGSQEHLPGDVGRWSPGGREAAADDG